MPALIEAVPIGDIFASDLGRVDILGKNIRLIWYTERFPEEGAPAEYVVVAKIVIPVDQIAPAVARLLFAVGEPAHPLLIPAPRRLS